MSFPSESDMISKELQNSDSIYVKVMTDVFKIIAIYRHLLPSGNRALQPGAKNENHRLCHCFLHCHSL